MSEHRKTSSSSSSRRKASSSSSRRKRKGSSSTPQKHRRPSSNSPSLATSPSNPKAPSNHSSILSELSDIERAEAALAARKAELAETEAALAARKAVLLASTPSSSTTSSPMQCEPSIALFSAMKSFVKSKGLSDSEGGSIKAPLRVANDGNKERDLCHEFSMVVLKAKKKSVSGAGDPIFGILTTAPVEFVAVLSEMQDLSVVYVSSDDWSYWVGVLAGVLCVVTKSDQSSIGPRGAQRACAALRSDWPSVRSLAAVGIAWGAPDIGLGFGDVLVSTAILNYDWKEQKGNRTILRSAPHDLSSGQAADGFSAPSKTGWSLSTSDGRKAKAVCGLIVSSATLQNSEKTTRRVLADVRAHCPGWTVIGGEMEGAGLVAVSGMSIPVAVIKAVVDFGGVGEEKGRAHQPFAAVAAVSYVKASLASGWVQELPPPLGPGLKAMDFTGLIAENVKQFVGRDAVTRRVEAWRVGSSSQKLLVLEGEPGVGKSAWVSSFIDEHPDIVAAHHFFQFSNGKSLDGRMWLNSIVSQLAAFTGSAVDPSALHAVATGERASDVAPAFSNFIKSLPREAPATSKAPALIVLDSLDEMYDAGDRVQVFQALRRGAKNLPGWLRILATTRPDKRVKKALSHASFQQLASEAEGEADLTQWFKVHQPKLDGRLASKLVAKSKGNFLYALELAQMDGLLEDLMNGDAPVPESLMDVYSERARVLWKTSAHFKKISPIMEVLVAATDPVPIAVLEKAAKANGLSSTVKVKTAVGALSSVLKRGRGAGKTVEIYHKSFVTWLVDTGWSKSHDAVDSLTLDPERGHAALWKVCRDLWSQEGDVWAGQHAIVHGSRAGTPAGELLDFAANLQLAVTNLRLDGVKGFGEAVALSGGAALFAQALVKADRRQELQSLENFTKLRLVATCFQTLGQKAAAVEILERAAEYSVDAAWEKLVVCIDLAQLLGGTSKGRDFLSQGQKLYKDLSSRLSDDRKLLARVRLALIKAKTSGPADWKASAEDMVGLFERLQRKSSPESKILSIQVGLAIVDLHKKLKDLKSALEVMTSVVTVARGRRGEGRTLGVVLYQKAKLLAEMDQFKEALAAGDEAVKLLSDATGDTSDLGECLMFMGRAHRKLKQYDEALVMLERAEDLFKQFRSPRRWIAVFETGKVLFYLKRKEEAFKAMENARRELKALGRTEDVTLVDVFMQSARQ